MVDAHRSEVDEVEMTPGCGRLVGARLDEESTVVGSAPDTEDHGERSGAPAPPGT